MNSGGLYNDKEDGDEMKNEFHHDIETKRCAKYLLMNWHLLSFTVGGGAGPVHDPKALELEVA